MKIEMLLPIVIIVSSNIFYNISTKAMPEAASPFAALAVTYLLAAAMSLIFLAVQNKGISASMFKGLNWTVLLLAVCITFLEFGYILAFRAGWNISLCSMIANTLLAVALAIIGVTFYRESITLRQAGGMALCLIGLGIMNLK